MTLEQQYKLKSELTKTLHLASAPLGTPSHSRTDEQERALYCALEQGGIGALLLGGAPLPDLPLPPNPNPAKCAGNRGSRRAGGNHAPANPSTPAGLAHLAVKYLSQGLPIVAYICAVWALIGNSGEARYWLLAAAAAGRIGDPMLLDRFCELFGQAFPDLSRHPLVVEALSHDPDLDGFVTSPAFMLRLEDKLLDADKALRTLELAGPDYDLRQ